MFNIISSFTKNFYYKQLLYSIFYTNKRNHLPKSSIHFHYSKSKPIIQLNMEP